MPSDAIDLAGGRRVDLVRISVTACFDEKACGTDASATIGGTLVRAAHLDTGSDAQELIELTAPQGVVYFEADDLELAMGHMSEDMNRERRERVAISAGVLEDGSAAAVIRIDWSSQHYREGIGPRGLKTTCGAREKHADVVVCALGATPSCARPVRVDCRRRGCTSTLVGGSLSIATSHGTETHHVVPACALTRDSP